MLCKEKCPRNTDCEPLSNVVADNGESFVCVGLHNIVKKNHPQDIYRHCFKSIDTDSIHDYDEYDFKSVISVMSEVLLIKDLKDSE